MISQTPRKTWKLEALGMPTDRGCTRPSHGIQNFQNSHQSSAWLDSGPIADARSQVNRGHTGCSLKLVLKPTKASLMQVFLTHPLSDLAFKGLLTNAQGKGLRGIAA